MKTLILGTAVVFLSFSSAIAQETKKETTVEKATETSGYGLYSDADKDGVCDHYAERHLSNERTGFTDKNNDGVCDNETSHGHRGRHGDGHGYRHGNGYGQQHFYGHGYHHGKKSDE